MHAEEISIIKDKDPDVKQVEFNGLTYFLVTPLFMNEVEIIDKENNINEEIINYYEEMEDTFKKSIAAMKRQENIIKALVITTTIGFNITLGIITGIIVYSVLSYYANLSYGR